MNAVDTNILVRFLVRDDEKQARAVYRLLKKAEKERCQVFVTLAVILETIWVLESAYNKSRGDILQSISSMRQMPVFSFERDEVVERMVTDGEKYSKADLSDLLIAHSAKSSGCGKVETFDRGAATHPLFCLLK